MAGRCKDTLSEESSFNEPALPCTEHWSTEKSRDILPGADSASSHKLCNGEVTLWGNASSLPGSKGHFHGVQKGTGIGKHIHGRGIGRACKLAHLEVAADHIGHVLLTSPRLLRSPGRKKSPIRWFPRKKTESFLERKIRMLQVKDGNVASLDETLGAANLHLSRIEREKLAAQAAAAEAIYARKGALIEASWCRILKLAGIPCKSAISELQNAEKKAVAALAEAENHGVILQHGTVDQREPASEAVTASLETAFDVDKEVTAAIKVALQQVHYSRDRACDSQHEADSKSTSLDTAAIRMLEAADSLSDIDTNSNCKCEEQMSPTAVDTPQKDLCSRPRKKNAEESKVQHSLVNLMESRIRELSLEHHTALAGIVATRGLSALLKDQSLEQELNGGTSGLLHYKPSEEQYSPKKGSDLGSILVKHVSRLQRDVQASKEANRHLQTEVEKRSSGHLQRLVAHVESLDQILVKHVSKLEKEKLAAQATRRTPPKQKCTSVALEETLGLAELLRKPQDESETCKEVKGESQTCSQRQREKLSETSETPFSTVDLGRIPIKHVVMLEKEKQEALTARESTNTPATTEILSYAGRVLNPLNELLSCNAGSKKTQIPDSNELPDLGSVLVKHVSRLEKEKQMALALQDRSNTPGRKIDKGKQSCEASLGDILVKRLSKLEIEKTRLSESGITTNIRPTGKGSVEEPNCKENSCLDTTPENMVTGQTTKASWQRAKAQERRHMDSIWSGQSLEDAMQSAKSTLVQITAGKPLNTNIPRRKSLREKQMEDAWGGLSLGNALKPHVSKLEKEQAAWKRAEEEARQRPSF